jgi:hypothetical protein
MASAHMSQGLFGVERFIKSRLNQIGWESPVYTVQTYVLWPYANY